MTRLLVLVIASISALVIGLAWVSNAYSDQAQHTNNTNDTVARFTVLDIYLDATTPVAAWQFALTQEQGNMRVVGVETGTREVFGQQSYYDLKAVAENRADHIRIADYSIAPESQLPRGRVHLSRVHLMVTDAAPTNYTLRLEVAADTAGRPIEANISWQEKHHD